MTVPSGLSNRITIRSPSPLDRIKALAPDASRVERQGSPSAPCSKGTSSPCWPGTPRDRLELLAASHAGMTTDEFERIVAEWMATARHPRFDRPYTELVYRPMRELLAYLQTNGFTTYIVSGGGVEFMRPWVEPVYGIPRERVIGSSHQGEVRAPPGPADC